jgi:cytochrome c-type biogenesis protein CcmH/NrfG
LKRSPEALDELEAVMKKEPNRFRTRYYAAQAAALAGDQARAERYFSELVKMCPKGDPSRGELAEAKKRARG